MSEWEVFISVDDTTESAAAASAAKDDDDDDDDRQALRFRLKSLWKSLALVFAAWTAWGVYCSRISQGTAGVKFMGGCFDRGALMPGYLLVIYMVTKNLGTLILFGPASPLDQPKWYHELMFGTFFLMFLYTGYADAELIWHHGLECAPTVLLCSGNVPGSFAMLGMKQIYTGALRWREAHDSLQPQDPMMRSTRLTISVVAGKIRQSKGQIAAVFYQFASYYAVFLQKFISLLEAPLAVIYFWLAWPLIQLIYWLSVALGTATAWIYLKKKMRPECRLQNGRKQTAQEMRDLFDVRGHAPESLAVRLFRAWAWDSIENGSDEHVVARYRENAIVYEKVGTPLGWNLMAIGGILPAVTLTIGYTLTGQLLGALIAYFVDCHNSSCWEAGYLSCYWSAATTVFAERKICDYYAHLTASVRGPLNVFFWLSPG